MLTFPFILIGTFSALIQQTVLTKSGFFASLFHLSKWVPYYRYLHYPFDNLTALTLDSVAVVAAFGAAKYHAKLHQRDDQLAGLTAAIALLVMAYQYADDASAFNDLMLGTNGLTGALIVGGLTGEFFKWFGRPIRDDHDVHTGQILSRTFQSLLPMVAMLIVALLVSLGLNWLIINTQTEQLWENWQKYATTSHSVWVTFAMAALTLLLEIIGLFGPYQQQLAVNTPAMNANLNAALTNHSATNVPYPFTASTLYHAFGTFGGTGMLLALVIAIFIGSNNHNYHVVARWGLLPALFNSNGPILTGLPVLYNPIYVIPFLLAPLLNMAIAATAIAFKWMPPVVYPVPVGTPGPLIAFIGTDGNPVALILGGVCLILSVLIYLPFMSLAEATVSASVIKATMEGASDDA